MLKRFLPKVSAGLLILTCMLSCTMPAYADPWYTGPLLAPAGHTVPKGHTNLEVYGFYNYVNGFYNRHGRFLHALGSDSLVLNPIFGHGITDRIDVQFSLPYLDNRVPGASSVHVGDTAAAMGFQLLEQKDSKWRPDLRLSIQEIFPTGTYLDLDPVNNGVDASGLGSYQTAIGFNFQHRTKLSNVHYLRTRLCLTYVLAHTVDIHGLSVYGGTPMTDGHVRPGNFASIDAAAELSLTQNWVAVMETFAANRQRSTFRGFVGFNANGQPGTIGHGAIDFVTLAPAVEYNFTENIGVIAGPWFTVGGRNAAHFTSYVIALNAFW